MVLSWPTSDGNFLVDTVMVSVGAGKTPIQRMMRLEAGRVIKVEPSVVLVKCIAALVRTHGNSIAPRT
jgi:hypothetical protein